jgi:hypothetical protein
VRMPLESRSIVSPDADNHVGQSTANSRAMEVATARHRSLIQDVAESSSKDIPPSGPHLQ